MCLWLVAVFCILIKYKHTKNLTLTQSNVCCFMDLSLRDDNFYQVFSAKVKKNRQRTGKKQYTNTKEIKNDTPKRAYGRLERTRDLWALLRLLDFSRPDLNVKWAPFIRKCFRSCNLMIYREKSVHTPVFLTFKTPTQLIQFRNNQKFVFSMLKQCY